MKAKTYDRRRINLSNIESNYSLLRIWNIKFKIIVFFSNTCLEKPLVGKSKSKEYMYYLGKRWLFSKMIFLIPQKWSLNQTNELINNWVFFPKIQIMSLVAK